MATEWPSHWNYPAMSDFSKSKTNIMRSWTAESPIPYYFLLFFSDIFIVVQLCGLRKKMAADPRACHTKQVLLVSFFADFYQWCHFIHLTTNSLLMSTETVVYVWEASIRPFSTTTYVQRETESGPTNRSWSPNSCSQGLHQPQMTRTTTKKRTRNTK